VLSIKCELNFRPVVGNGSAGGKEKEKDSRIFVVGVELKSEREFVVLTSGKSQTYAAEDPTLASTWVSKITSVLELYQQQQQPTRTRT